jgi:hypothetical protein
VSLYRGVGAITGLTATALTPPMMKRLGPVATGWMGIAFQVRSASKVIVYVVSSLRFSHR